MVRPAFVAIGVLMGASALGAFLGMRARPRPIEASFVIPRTSTPIKIDGELDEPSWVGNPARTGAFPGKPYSDARMLWDDTTLYLALYAADEDIETRTTEHDGPLWLDDAFRLVFDVKGTQYKIEVSPKCIIADGRGPAGKVDHIWESGARVACDTDGTINAPNDMDEEWVVEMAVPLETIGIERDTPFRLSIERCDTPKNERRSCTTWSEVAVLR
jgi:hypothetical protein